MPSKKQIDQVVREERERLRDDPNVVGCGYGVKRRQDKAVPGLAIVYVVRVKCKNAEQIKQLNSTALPDVVEGFPTDVIEQRPAGPTDMGMPTGQRGTRIEDPLVGGTTTTVLSDWHSFPTGYGTLGGLCYDAASGREMALSNAHVWGKDLGNDVIQPWMPTGEYLEATIKLLTCGPVVSYILDTTITSPLTVALAAASAGAWLAWAAWDAEDPSRWGQRVAPVPPGARTEAERIVIKAELPNRPFAGRAYSAKTSWDYTRETSQGTFNQATTAERTNEHVLTGKRVWTERDAYHGGERVRVCAELATERADHPDDYFVVAHCFPRSDPERVLTRVLVPGRCDHAKPREEEIGFHGFPPPAQPNTAARFPFDVDAFHFDSAKPSVFHGPWPPGDPHAVTVLRIPGSPLTVVFPSCSQVRLEVFHTNRPVQAEAYNSTGQLVASTQSTDEQNVLQVLTLTGADVTRVVLSGGGGEGALVGVWIRRAMNGQGGKRFVYTGHLDLDLREPADRWGVALFVQTVNNVPPGTDPAKAAQVIGGITASNNIADLAGCVVVMLLDHVFDVI